MIKRYLGHILASSVLWTSAISPLYAADTAADTAKVKIQRSFVNLGFNQPALSSNNTTDQFAETAVEGWLTTHPNPKLIEIWRGRGAASTSYSNWSTINNSPSANQYAELNASAQSALYQNVCLFKDEEFIWNFRHAARSSTNEQATFYIGKVSADRFSFSKDQTIGTSQSVSNLFEWKFANPNGNKAKVNVQSGIYQFIFDATRYGSNATLGNFIDDISLSLKPAVEFSADSGRFYEGSETTGQNYSVPFNIVGQILSSADMPTLQFKIEYPTAYTQTKAVYGTHYRLYKRIGSNLVELNSSDGLVTSNANKVTFNYTPVYNSNLDYTKGVQVNDLVIKILGNTQTNGDVTLPFSFALDATSKAIATSLSACGNVSADVTFDLKIQEDDIDLSVVKTLTPESVIQKDSLVSYKLDVTNNTAVQADGVVLRDNFKNLLRVTTGAVASQTALVCEDLTDGTSKACPAIWTDTNALTSLFTTTSGSGLNLGNIPAYAKYRFTIKNLKVTDTDTSITGYVENTAIIESTKMYDLDSTNNTSTVKTLIATKSDLSNNTTSAPTSDAAATGVGMFVIGKEGRTGTTPLWTQKAIANTKVYFPLNIQNYANLAQDYQLYASSTAVSPTLSSGDYSTLVKSGINPFSSGLKVEFFALGNAQCKVGTSGGQQITQLTVPANTTGEVCAVATLYGSANAKQDIWFAIESMQSGLGDVIRNAITSDHLQQRLLELLNDQTAQVNAGGTYVFSHRLLNRGVISEQNINFKLIPFTNDGFLYTLFEDVNKNGILDAVDRMISNQAFSIAASAELALLIKVQAPAIATNGMSSQVKLEAVPDNNGQSIILASLSNTDNIIVSSNQLHIQKMQYKQANCTAMDNSAVKNAVYSIQNVTLKLNDCLIYRITVKNIGDSELKNVSVNDMYPAYTIPWKPNAVLPMTSTGDNVQDDGAKVKTILPSLLPQAEKSLYFGIKMQ
ncbi:DUF11 domain-containing protein [Acinetobacter albensis]|uniref:Conserved repeat domain-containing protein n=1 Tax=Acinetobacter albensis TaxID=1673609 RepID=A0A1C4GW93_9GAMM|nr:DUF11 domain-containing protein [Acinetobacter albensis]SCC72469.1 conserved repeat domain-containing protein [Acinetobacter albensis]